MPIQIYEVDKEKYQILVDFIKCLSNKEISKCKIIVETI